MEVEIVFEFVEEFFVGYGIVCFCEVEEDGECW